jgi:hypothetical protein
MQWGSAGDCVVNLYYRLTFNAMSYSTWVRPILAAGMRRIPWSDRQGEASEDRGATNNIECTSNHEINSLAKTIIDCWYRLRARSVDQATKPEW